MSSSGIYGHLTESELVELRDACVANIKLVLKGEKLVQVTIAGKSVTKQLPTLEELKNELVGVKQALQAIDPVTYGKKRRRFGIDHRNKRV